MNPILSAIIGFLLGTILTLCIVSKELKKTDKIIQKGLSHDDTSDTHVG